MAVYRLAYDSSTFPRNFITPDEVEAKLPKGRAGMMVGTPRLENWRVLEGTYYYDPERPKKVPCPDLSKAVGEMVFSEKAKTVLGEVLEGYGEFLPILIEGDQRYIFNLLKATDAIDPFNSKKEIFDGMVIGVEKIAFVPEMVEDMLIFYTFYDNFSYMYCTGKFIALIENSGLSSGWSFESELR